MAEDHLFVLVEIGVRENGHWGYLVLVGLAPCHEQGLLVRYHRAMGPAGSSGPGGGPLLRALPVG
jgi:hypothetical protein